ncbi:hypothetical protein BCR42DRAFT_399302 [Absidia repens]|uniref:GSKIP domain-containing protein n=1 Tax=Absidia repens TaxID=90262 RepID=A0A1X2IZS3_9FUNG|nr:hypothetical protein BCR42DRAFT_399302 [Absidia repens]
MRFEALDKKLDAICKDYDYGIVPGSVTVYIRDRVQNTGRMELTILEGIMLIIDAFDEGFMVTSCTPFIDSPTMANSLKLVQDHLQYMFDTMDNLLMTISPLFAQRFLDKIQTTCISPTLTDLPKALDDSTITTALPASSSSIPFNPLLTTSPSSSSSPSLSSSSSTAAATHVHQSQQQTSNVYNDIFDWIH